MTAVPVDWTVLLTGGGILVGVVSSHVRLETRLNNLSERFHDVEKVVGLNGSPPAFVRTGECAIIQRTEHQKETKRGEAEAR